MSPASRLAKYIRSLPDFEIVEGPIEPYCHMGATITEAVFQAGLNYETVVRPRVQKILDSHPAARTSSIFLALLREHGGANLLAWKEGARKLVTLDALTAFFVEKGVESEEDLGRWLIEKESAGLLHEIKGVGPKTIDCLRLLAGIPTVAVDVHLRRFLREAGVQATGYEAAKSVISEAAEILELDLAILDLSIWQYMSNRSSTG